MLPPSASTYTRAPSRHAPSTRSPARWPRGGSAPTPARSRSGSRASRSPKAVYGSGPTGFALCRELRAPGVDCVVGAVSRMQRPSAEKRRKNDRRDAAFLARPLATRNITEVRVPPVEAEAARDLSRARRRPRGPAARPPAALQVPAGARARVRRDRRARAQARRPDEGALEVGGVLQAVRPGRGGRLRPLRRLRAPRRVRQARPGEEGARRGPRRPVEGRGRGVSAGLN